MNTDSTDSQAGVASAAPCSRLSDVETELRRMAERCRKPAPSGALVLDLAADIVARSGKDAAEVIRLQNAIRSFVTDFERVDWGWDGDCGSKDLVDALFESISANKEQEKKSRRNKR
jgi:hypothetical protein